MDENLNNAIKENLGSRRIPKLRMANFPTADEIVRQGLLSRPRSEEAVDILLVNPPTPDGGYWIRTQHRVGRRTRENMVWPQVSLAQMAALLHPAYKVKVIDANAERMGWPEFARLLDKYQPKYYLTQVTAPTLENDMYGCFLAKARGCSDDRVRHARDAHPARIAAAVSGPGFRAGGRARPDLRDLLDHLENKFDQRSPEINKLFEKHDPSTSRP
jgi:anaerobic magnesium-protoporphyrin IX monomethyl ester cyclase